MREMREKVRRKSCHYISCYLLDADATVPLIADAASKQGLMWCDRAGGDDAAAAAGTNDLAAAAALATENMVAVDRLVSCCCS